MKLFVCLIGLLCAGAITAQEAKIIIVEKDDTAALRASYKEYKAALERWEKTKTTIAKKYTFENGKVLEGWDKIEFSVDFRALVPKTALSYYSGGYWMPTSTTNATLTGTTATTGLNITAASAADRSVSLSDVEGIRPGLTTTEKK